MRARRRSSLSSGEPGSATWAAGPTAERSPPGPAAPSVAQPASQSSDASAPATAKEAFTGDDPSGDAFEEAHALLALAQPGAVLHLAGELSAGGIDVVSAGAANRRDDAGIDEPLREGADARLGRTAQARVRKRIERNQVELARHVAHALEQRLGVRVAVVHAVEHHVLEGDEVARRTLEIAPARLHQLGQRVLAVQRDEPVAQRVVGRVQRDGERDRAV